MSVAADVLVVTEMRFPELTPQNDDRSAPWLDHPPAPHNFDGSRADLEDRGAGRDFGLKFGIGYMFFFWFQQFEIRQTLAWIMMFVILMFVLEHGVFARLESRAFAWRKSSLAHGTP